MYRTNILQGYRTVACPKCIWWHKQDQNVDTTESITDNNSMYIYIFKIFILKLSVIFISLLILFHFWVDYF